MPLPLDNNGIPQFAPGLHLMDPLPRPCPLGVVPWSRPLNPLACPRGIVCVVVYVARCSRQPIEDYLAVVSRD